MAKRRLLRSLILAIASIAMAIVLALAYVVLTDESRAFNDVLKAAEQGNATAQFKLGEMYYDGELVTQDYNEALKWYKKSAEQGNVGAQLKLGERYADCNSVPQDYVEAYNSKQTAATKTGDKRKKQEIGVDIGIVTAIMYVDGTSLAVIDGVILREGQSIRQVKVVKINPDSVEFDYNGNRWSQKVNELSSTQGIGTVDLRILPKYPSVEDIFKYVSPAVVSIIVYDDIGDVIAFGSGFFIGNGEILTNAHVVEGAYSAEVCSVLKAYEDVTIIKLDDELDLALLEVNSVGEPIISFADDSELRVGQRVLAIGNPLRLERTLSDGLISAIRYEDLKQEIQISAPVSHGSSGGPLLNMQGQVIGITYAGYDEGQNLNFAIGIKTLKSFLKTPEHPEQLKTAGSYIPGKVVHYWIKKIVIGVVAFAIGIVVIIYGVIFLIRILKRLFRLATTPFRRLKISNPIKICEEQNKILELSKEKKDFEDKGDKSHSQTQTLPFQNIAIKRKFIVIVMVTCTISLLLVGSIFIFWEWCGLRNNMFEQLSSQARITAENCKAALIFEYKEDAKDSVRKNSDSMLHYAEHTLA